MKKIFNYLEILAIASLSLCMMAQPAFLIFNYVISRRATRGEEEQATHAKRRKRAVHKMQKHLEAEVDSLADVEVVAIDDGTDTALVTARETRGYHGSPWNKGRSVGYEDGSYDGANGNARYSYYDDSNTFVEDECVKYKRGYETGYREGYNASMKEL